MQAVLLDTSVFIRAERRGQDIGTMLRDVERLLGRIEPSVSVLTLMELAHGEARADSDQRRVIRRAFVRDLMDAMPTHAVTAEIALHAGRLDGEMMVTGQRIASNDLLIGVTALALGCSVGTSNLRHFGRILGLIVISLP